MRIRHFDFVAFRSIKRMGLIDVIMDYMDLCTVINDVGLLPYLDKGPTKSRPIQFYLQTSNFLEN